MKFAVFFITVVLGSFSVLGQGTKEDYERARNLEDLVRNQVVRDSLRPHWIDDHRFWYRIDTGLESFEFILVDAEKGTRGPAFDHEKVAVALSNVHTDQVDPQQLPFRALEWNANGLAFRALGRRWLWVDAQTLIESGTTSQGDTTATVLNQIKPSGSRGRETHVTFVNRTKEQITLYWIDRDGERVRYGEIASGKTHQQHTFQGHVWEAVDAKGQTLGIYAATADESDAVIDGTWKPKANTPPKNKERKREKSPRGNRSPNGQWTVFVKDHNLYLQSTSGGEATALTNDGTGDDYYTTRLHWSPDSKYLAAVQEQAGEKREVHFIETSPKDQLQPKLHQREYAKPGDKLPVARPRLIDIAAKKAVQVSDELFPNAWRISQLRWRPDSKAFTFHYNQRGHQVFRVVSVDVATGEARALIDEPTETFVCYSYKSFAEYLDKTDEIVWMSERDGWNHLYLIDALTGKVKNQITNGQWVVRQVERVDHEKRQIWFAAGGVYPDQDPYYLHLCRVNFDGSDFTILTKGDGTHEWAFSPTKHYFIGTWSRVDHPPVRELRHTQDGSLVMTLEQADWSALLKTGWQAPERFVSEGRDGETPIYGVIYRPTTFDPTKRYPIIESIYAGPHGSFTPKRFSAYRRDQALAELGFIVVKMDGMGTNHRSKAFHDVCWRNLGDSGFPDRKLWIQAAAKKYPFMDLSRIGIFGGSAGGQSTLRALLAHGDFYHVGVSDCGCHDNRMDKVWWNEQWMGWPIGDHYADQSNVTQAHRLTGKLLLTVGELDYNVDPASTMQVVDALIRADKDFDLIVFPGRGHGIGSGPYGTRRMWDFFVRHLYQREPRT